MRNFNPRLLVFLIVAVGSYFTVYHAPTQAQTTVYRITQTYDAEARGAAPPSGTPTPDTRPKQCAPDKTGSTLVCSQGPDALKGLHWGVGLLYSSSLSSIGGVSLVKSGAN